MAAGLGFKTFTTGEVLTANDTNGYLMQGVLVFASSAARASAITSPQEGQYSYLKDTNSTEYYDGAAWVSGVEGDISGVTAGTGISGGGTSGTVTVTNSMATAIDAKGDLIPGTGADAFARLAVGTNGQVLTAASGEASGLKYTTPGLTFIQSTTFTAAATLNISSVFSSTYDNYRVVCVMKGSTADANIILRMLTGTTTQDTSASYFGSYTETTTAPATSVAGTVSGSSMSLGTVETTASIYWGQVFDFMSPALTNATHSTFQGAFLSGTGAFVGRQGVFAVNTATAYTGFCFIASTGNLEGGTVKVYGYNNA